MLGLKRIEKEGWKIEKVWNRYETGISGAVTGDINIKGDKNSLLAISIGFLEKYTTVTISDSNGNIYGKFPSRDTWVNGLTSYFYVPNDAVISIVGNGAWIDEIFRVKFNKLKIVHGYQEYSFPAVSYVEYYAPSTVGYRYIIVCMAGFCSGVISFLDNKGNTIYALRSDSNNIASSYIVTALPEITKYRIVNTCTIASNEICEVIAYVG